MPSFRKRIVQVGVVLFIAQMSGSNFGYFLFLSIGQYSILPYLLFQFGTIFLVIAAVMPANDRDAWGSMWPLVGYDNAIDGIYTRGPWLVRFRELEELEEERRVTDGLATLFGGQ